jgi:hypothetical protein
MSSEAKHTPKLTALGDKIYGETPEDGIIARIYSDEDLAARFVACFDACAGIPTEQLEAGCVERLLRAAQELQSQVGQSGWQNAEPTIRGREDRADVLNNLRDALDSFQKDSRK